MGLGSITIVEELLVRTPKVSVYHYCFVNVVGVGAPFEKERDREGA